jgi:protein HOOK3
MRVKSLTEQIKVLQSELESTKADLRRVQAEKDRESEAVAAFEERVKELELGRVNKRSNAHGSGSESDDGELANALSSTSVTDLKLQVRRLQREVAKLKSQDQGATGSSSTVEEAERMRGHYEREWLAEHRAKLVLEANLEEILNGQSRFGDG